MNKEGFSGLARYFLLIRDNKNNWTLATPEFIHSLGYTSAPTECKEGAIFAKALLSSIKYTNMSIYKCSEVF